MALRTLKPAFVLLSGLLLSAGSAVAGERPSARTAAMDQCLLPPEKPAKVVHVRPSLPLVPGSLSNALLNPEPGTEIRLASGNYGDVALKGANAAYVTLKAEDGAEPVFTRLSIKGSGWRVQGISVIGWPDPSFPLPASLTPRDEKYLVYVHDSKDVAIEGGKIASALGGDIWEQRVRGQTSPIPLLTGIQGYNVSCFRVADNEIVNIFNGVAVGGYSVAGYGSNIEVLNNRIHNIGGDGVDHFGSHIEIAYNKIYDAKNICDAKCIHPDGIQGWNYNNKKGLTNVDVKIHDNVIISNLNAKAPLNWGKMQGITIFNGGWDSVTVRNNLVLVGTWHGMTLAGVRNATVEHNTVLTTDPHFAAWVMIENQTESDQNPPLGTIVSNNIVGSVLLGSRPTSNVKGVELKENRLHAKGEDIFRKFRPETGEFDLRLRKPPVNGAVPEGSDLQPVFPQSP
jgi:hypothetical protein